VPINIFILVTCHTSHMQDVNVGKVSVKFVSGICRTLYHRMHEHAI